MTSVDAVIESVRQHVEAHGGVLAGAEQLKAELTRRTQAPPAPAAAPVPEAEPTRSAPVLLTPEAADVRYSDVWIAEIATGKLAMVHVTNHCRPPGDPRASKRKKRWYGIDLVSGRRVRIVRVVEGTRR